MANLILVEDINITVIGKEPDGQIVLQFDPSDNTELNPGTQTVIDDLDGNVCVMDIVSFRKFVLKSMAALANVDPLFSELLNCGPSDSADGPLDFSLGETKSN